MRARNFAVLSVLGATILTTLRSGAEPDEPSAASHPAASTASRARIVAQARSAASRPATRGQDSTRRATSGADTAAAPANARSPSTQPAGEARLAVEESIARFQQVLARRPLHDPAFAGLIKHFAEQGKLADLVKEYEQKVKALPDQSAIKIVLARMYLRAGQAPRAAEILEKIDKPPTSSTDDESKLLVLKSEVFQQTGRNDAARTMLEGALQKARTVSERFKLGEALADLEIRTGEPKKAADVLLTLGKQFPDSYLHRKHVADALSQRSLHEAAAGEYRAILPLVEKEPDKRCEVLRQIGRSYEQLEKRQDAIDAYTEAVNLLSGGHWLQRELHDRIVTLYRATGRLQDLVVYCRKQIERSPEQTAMRVLLSDVLAAAGDMDAAKKTLAEAVQLFPKDLVLSERRVQLLERAGDETGVAAEYERIISQQPNDVELYIGYGQFLANHKQLEAARNQWKHVLNGELADPGLAIRLAGLFEPYDLLDDAVECYERAIKLAPKRPEAYTALSRLWQFRGKKDQATETLRRMASAHPDDAATHATLCQGLLNLGQADEALVAISKACELDPRQVQYQLNRADVLVHLGRVADALKVRRASLDLIQNPGQLAAAIEVLVSMHASSNQLDALRTSELANLEKDDKSILSLMLLARAADFDRQFAEARKWLNRLLSVEPRHEEARRQLAKLLEALGDTDSAVEAYQRLSELYPARARQYYQAIADMKLRYNDKAGAIDTFEKMVQASPGNATVLKSVAEQLTRMQEFEKAIKLYEQALKIQPDMADVRLAFGKALFDAGRLDDALAEFKKTALQRTDRESAIEAMGRLHETAGHLGKVDDLLADLQQRVEQNPDDSLTAQMLAELLIREFEYNRAMDMLDLVLRAHPRDAELQMVRGEVLRRLARFDEAIEAYRSAMRIPNTERDFVMGELGKAFFEAGRIEQARAVWRQIGHKLYAGSLLRNNGLLDDAIDVLREGIRLKPDDYGLHRNLIGALRAAGKIDESLEAARHLLDLEPDNVYNIQQVAKAYLDRNNRAAAAEVAARMFSAGVVEKKDLTAPAAGSSWSGGATPLWAASVQAAWGQGRSVRSNLDRAVEFFTQNGLLAELEDTLVQQMKTQPDNAILRERAAGLFSETFGKPEEALRLYRELETAKFPLEHQDWLGQCSQRDAMRVKQFHLIGSKPGLRDKRQGELEARGDKLDRDGTLELAVIRQSQGANDKAIEMLQGVVKADATDVVALSALVDMLVRAEKFKDAEPYAVSLITVLAQQRSRMQKEMIERVRRDFVRSLPVQFQLRVSEELLRDIADKWTLGSSMMADFTGFVQTMGYFRAQMTLATIYAKTSRMSDARRIWNELEPHNPADADGWTMLAGVAQLHEQNDLAYGYYQKALTAAKILAADSLLQQIYSSSLSAMWYGGEQGIDSTFNKIVDAFAGQNKLPELYDFLRDTDQTAKARRVAEQYTLYDDLKSIYRQRVESARTSFRNGTEDPIHRSTAYFTEVCKLAELHDQTGNWPEALRLFEQYLEDFPDELGLLLTLGEAAEAQEEYDKAVTWEKKALQTKERLLRKAREWAMRSLYLTPAPPQVLRQATHNQWEWQQRWGKGTWWGWGSQQNPLELWPSWLRIAQLYLSLENYIAAGDAMERAVGAAGGERKQVADQILNLIQQRQLTTRMLPVVRSLAVNLPLEERVQLAFAESLEANNKADVAGEVYRRMLRRGVSDIGILARVRDKLKSLAPAAAEEAIDTIERLEAAVVADKDNANNALRLAKAYYYSLQIDKALGTLTSLEKSAPHLEGLQDLLIEIHTIRDDRDALIAALRKKIKRSKGDDEKRQARHHLVQELLAAGKNEEALKSLKDLADPKDPQSYQRVGALLHYFGRHDEAIKQYELAGKSQQRGGWMGGQDAGKADVARALVVKGDFKAAAKKIVESVEEQSRQATQYSAMAGLYSMYDNEQNPFEQFVPLFVMKPQVLDEVRRTLVVAHEAKPDDPQAARHLMQLYQRIGRPDLADAMLEKLTARSASDQSLVSRLIDRAVERRQFEKAADMARKWIDQQPKPKLPPGVPPQYAGMMMLMSARNAMTCKLGDIYWKMGDREKAFEAYKQIIDEQIDESRLAYAGICALRGRIEEARKLVDETLEKQKVKSPNLLQFRCLLAMMESDPRKAFDLLAESIEVGEGQESNPYSYMGNERGGPSMLAEFAQRAGKVDDFIKFMKKRIKKNPNDWENHRLLATTCYSLGRIDDAFAALDRAAKVKSLNRDVMQQRAEWMESYAPADELVALYRKLIDAAEKKVSARPSGRSFSGYFGGQPQAENRDAQPLRDRLAAILWDRGDKAEAEKVWSERLNLKTAASHIKLGRCFEERQEYDRAEQAFRKAMELEPDNVEVHQALADLEFHKKNNAQVADHLREVFLRRYQATASTNAGRRYYPWNYQNQNPDRNEDMRLWALELVRDPKVLERHDQGEESATADVRLALAVLTGDWTATETMLRGRLQSSPFDPMVWTLWAKVQEHKADWAEAAKAWEYLARLKRTSIPQHRDQLKLVLAGKHIKDAAAGSKQAPTQPIFSTSGGPSRSYSYYGRYYGGGPEGDDSRLAAIYARLGQFDKAERLYLLGGDGSPEGMMPSLAALMWQQGAKPRALELMDLGLVLSQDTNMAVQYAGLMAQAGKLEEAADLIVRTYRCMRHQERDARYGMYYAMYGGYGNDENSQFENWQETACTNALVDMLRRANAYDDVLARLSRRVTETPDDTRLAKLVLSLQIHDHRWADARTSLQAWSRARPDDAAIKAELLHVNMQLADWPAARDVLKDLREQAPESSDQWCATESFLQLMQTDAAGAVRAIEPLLKRPPSESGGVAPMQIEALLAAARQYDRLMSYLESLSSKNLIDDSGRVLLVRLYCMKHRWDNAAALASEQFWNQPTALSENSDWYRTLTEIVAAAAEQSNSLTPPARREDAALYALIRSGSAAGREAFATLAAQQPDNPNARRGLVLALMQAGDLAGAATANSALIEWLGSRRRQVWFAPPRPSISESATAFIETMRSKDLDGQAVLGMSMSFSSLLQQVLGSNSQPPVQYDALWLAHQQLQRNLLGGSRQTEKLAQALKDQSQLQHALQRAGSNQSPYGTRSYYSRGRYPFTSYSNFGNWQQGQGALATDWRRAFQDTCAQYRLLNPLADTVEKLGSRLPHDHWPQVSELYAALGRKDDAQTWRSRAVTSLLASLRASDEPSVASGADEYNWMWSMYGNAGGQEINNIRNSLQIGTQKPDLDDEAPPSDDQNDASDTDESFETSGATDELWELALVDRDAESGLKELEKVVGPGWDQSATVTQLLSFYHARKQYKQSVELIERVCDKDRLLRSQLLSRYLMACFETGDFERIGKVLDSATRLSASLASAVKTMRLVALRRQGKTAEADELERQLVARCVIERDNPHRIEKALLGGGMTADTDMTFFPVNWGGRMRFDYGNAWRAGIELGTLPALASAVGVRLDSSVQEGDPTLAQIRDMYSRHGLYRDASRIIDLEISRGGPTLTPPQRMALLFKKAEALGRAGDKGASSIVKEIESYWRAEAGERPWSAEPYSRLAALYDLKAAGPDRQKAYEALVEAARRDPIVDPLGMRQADGLYKLGRYADAWKRYQDVVDRGGLGLGRSRRAYPMGPPRQFGAVFFSDLGCTELYQAGICAQAGGDPDMARSLLRQALWRNPHHKLSGKAREVIHE